MKIKEAIEKGITRVRGTEWYDKNTYAVIGKEYNNIGSRQCHLFSLSGWHIPMHLNIESIFQDEECEEYTGELNPQDNYPLCQKFDNPYHNDPINPEHYAANGLEAIDVIDAFDLNFCLGNAIKYILRAGRKGGKDEDLKKAVWYLQREIEKEWE